jgi:hypothetical protein
MAMIFLMMQVTPTLAPNPRRRNHRSTWRNRRVILSVNTRLKPGNEI